MNLANIEEQLKNWHLRKFGRVDLDVAATMRKFGEEVGEFIEAVINGEPGPIAEEAGDVLFIMCHIVREFCGAGALNEAAVAKIGVIYERLHVEESGKARLEYSSCTSLPEFKIREASDSEYLKGVLSDNALLHELQFKEVEGDLPPLMPCTQRCDGCGSRFRCLDAGVPLPKHSLLRCK